MKVGMTRPSSPQAPMRLLIRPVTVLVWFGLLAALSPRTATAQESPSFRVPRVALSASTGVASSERFATRLLFAEQGPTGGMASACGSTWIQTAGFLSILTSGPVPVELTVGRASIVPLAIELSWTGTDTRFDVRRAFDAESMSLPGSLHETVEACSTQDPNPTENEIIFYLVLPAGADPQRRPQ